MSVEEAVVLAFVVASFLAFGSTLGWLARK